MYKRMDLNGIWGLFGFEDSQSKKEKQHLKELEEFKKTPEFKIGMFVKMISQGISFKKQLIDFFSTADPKLDAQDMGEAGDFMMHNRAYYWISECGTRKKDWKEALNKKASKDFLFCLEVSMKYFEELEEFERCAHLKKIHNFIEKSLKRKENLIS